MRAARSFGKSTGSPSEKGLQVDAQTALDYLNTRRRVAAPQRRRSGCVAPRADTPPLPQRP